QLPVPYAKANVNGGTAIPLPATVLVTRRCPPDKVRPLPPTPNQQTGLHGGLQKHTLGGGISNSTPSDGNSCPGSPQHNGTAIITQIPKGNNSLRMPQATNCKIPASPYSASNTLQHNNHHNNNNNTITLIPNGNVTNIPTNPAQQQQQHQKHSMLDKFKLFNSKEKQDRSAQKSQISKRTSSSSGFSSARSERSDSSLSLDNGHHQGSLQPTLPPTSAIPGAKIKESGLKKLDSASTKTSSPSPALSKSSSKLISSKSSSKESSKAKAAAEKLRNKDPGPDTVPQTHIPLAPQKVQKIPMATTVTTTSLATSAVASAMASKAQAKLASVGSSTSAGRKLDAKSESKTSLLQPQMVVPKTMVPPQQQVHQQQQQQQQQMQQPAVGTGIPKPMAAIKGTSKPSQPLTPTAGCGGVGKEELTVCKPQVPNNNNTVMGQLLQQQQQQQLVTNGAGNGMSDSMHSNSTQGASMGQHSTNSSETSSVVAYRPSSESGSEQLLQSPQKLLPPAGPLVYGGQPDVNLNSSNSSSSPGVAAGHVFHNGNGNLHHSNNNHNITNTANNNNNLSKFHTVPTKILNTGSPVQTGPNHTTIYEQEEKQITVLPMRPLLRGYNSHVTLPTRGTRGHHPHHPHVHHHQLMAADYCEDFSGQGGGYCSDGDALRKIPARYSDNIDNGYLSEGGGGGGASMLTSAGRQQHASYMSSLRARTQLPTTIEER
uniref:Protein sickie n=1 Tax=Anopheles dirus TaxID=7168 RepID=A0A182NEM2_9DIPT